MRRPIRTIATIAAAGLLASTAWLAGCVHRSGGTWMISSAPLPEGWPELTPIGEVRVRDYPAYRAAAVRQTDLPSAGMRPMFMELFRHIKSNQIAMTAPVEMAYDDAPGGRPTMASMAFLYRSPDLGDVGSKGAVRVEDLPPMTFASVGVRGAYTARNYESGLQILDRWLAETPGWSPEGPPRYLGYNSPFVPGFMRYGEVQIPVSHAGAAE